MTNRAGLINVGMNETQRKGSSDILNQVLADLSVLYIKTRNYHWNVIGMHFSTLHDLFEEQYNQLEATIDEVAERIRMLGERPLGTMSEFVSQASIKEHPGVYPTEQAMVSNLLNDHELCIRYLRENVNTSETQFDDVGTTDFLTGLLQQHEKTAWMLRAHLD
jgi:starvation-inducible DNA-binding protein